jgi:hypothetical protein
MSKNVQALIETVEKTFNACEQALVAMQVGERIQVKELAKNVGSKVSEDPKDILHFVNHFVHNTELAYVSRGKNGGVIRGQKTIKSVPTNIVADVPSDIDDI